MSFVSFRNKKINYQVSGRGNSTVVLLHGFLEDLSMWDDISKELSNHHRVIRVDLPGHGASENLSNVHEMPLIAEAILSVIDKEQLEEIKLVGHSMGGYIALSIVEIKPNLVKKIILLNSKASADNEQKKEDRLRAIEALKLSKTQFINTAIPNLFAEQSRVQLSSEIVYAKEVAHKTSAKGISAALLGMRVRNEMITWVKENETPVVYISGEEDPIMPLNIIKVEAKQTKSILHSIKGCGHMLHLEAKEQCIHLLLNELKN